MATLNFDASTVAPSQTFEPLVPGWYPMMIVASEELPTGGGKGKMLKLTLRVIEGPGAGRQVFDQLNIVNANQVAVDIAYQRLSAYGHATGVIKIADSQQLHGIPFMARLAIKTDPTGTYDPQNNVKAIKALGEATAHGAPSFVPQGAPVAQPNFGSVAPGIPSMAAPAFAQPQMVPQVAPAFPPVQMVPPQAPQQVPQPQMVPQAVPQMVPQVQPGVQQPPVAQAASAPAVCADGEPVPPWALG